MPWSQIEDPPAHLRAALGALYAHYWSTEAMTANVLRDAPLLPALAELMQDLPWFFVAVRDLLTRAWDVADDDRSLVEAAIGHALEFETWRSLTPRQGLADSQAVELMTRLVVCLTAPR
jgi:hypothetical protein